VVAADLHDGIGVEGGQFAYPHAGAGQQLDHEPVAGIAAGAGGGHEPGCLRVVEELRQRLGLLRDVTVDDRVAGRRIRPVPLDDPLEEGAHHPQPLPMCLRRDRPATWVRLGRKPHLEVLDVVAAHRGDGVQAGVGHEPPRELAQRVLCDVDALRRLERGQPLQIALDRGHDLRRVDLQARPLRGGGASCNRPVRARHDNRFGAHRAAPRSCTEIISATAAVSASINAAARRYSAASQSLVRCR
jgi:hypothetical protein